MLDKSVPYKNIIMEIDGEMISKIAQPNLSTEFSFRFFHDGDERHWARIETSVLEFDTERAALDYFRETFTPYQNLLKERCLFVVNSQGTPVATATAWCDMSKGDRPSMLHWVSVCPEYQGFGLGKAIVLEATRIFAKTNPGESAFLHTQTWSHKAVRLYSDVGYHLVKPGKPAEAGGDETGAAISPNDYDEALPILKGLLDEKTFSRILSTAK